MPEILRFKYSENLDPNESIFITLRAQGYTHLTRGDQKNVWRLDNQPEVLKIARFGNDDLSSHLEPEELFPIEVSAYTILSHTIFARYLVPITRWIYFEDEGLGEYYGYSQPYLDTTRFYQIKKDQLSKEQLENLLTQVIELRDTLQAAFNNPEYKNSELPNYHMFNEYNLVVNLGSGEVCFIEFELHGDSGLTDEEWLIDFTSLFNEHIYFLRKQIALASLT